MDCEHKDEKYSCLYWKVNGLPNVMRGWPCQLEPHKQEMESAGIKVRLRAF